MARDIVSAHSSAASTDDAIRELLAQLEGCEPVLVIFFASAAHDGLKICNELKRFAPKASVSGCTTAGEFTDQAYGTGGVSAMAFSAAKIKRVATVMVTYENGIEEGVRAAAQQLSQQFGADLRELDPERHVGFIFDEPFHFREDAVLEALGHAAPLLSFVGGSAGDDWQMKFPSPDGTDQPGCPRVFHNGRVSTDACVLTLMELTVPYRIIKSSSFEATETKLTMSKVNGRAVYEINGRPALQAYADAIGVAPEKMNHEAFGANPLGVMIDGEPWVRSVIGVLPDGALNFGAKMLEGAELHLLRYTDLIGDTNQVLANASSSLGGAMSGAVLFNCAHRCLAINAMKLQDQFKTAIAKQGCPVAGFHCYGEDYVVHLNQTLVGIVFG